MEHLGAHLQGLRPVLRSHRHDHKLLNVHVVGGVGTAVENVHHRHRQGLGVDAPQIAVQRHTQGLRRSLGHGHGHRQNGVGPQPGLVGGAVQLNHGLVDLRLIQSVHADNGIGNLRVYIGDGLGDGLTAVGLASVPKLTGLIDSRGGPGGNCRPAHYAAVQIDLRLQGGIPPGIKHLAGMYIQNFKILFHEKSS